MLPNSYKHHRHHLPTPSPLITSLYLLLLHVLPTYATVTGPVMPQQFPDPSLISVSNTWYAFGTGTTNNNIPYASSPDFNTWTLAVDGSGNPLEALPTLPDWVDADSPQVWAPDVSQLSDGTFLMYFCANAANDTGHHCIGAATSTSITGPYAPTSDSPLICPLSAGGAIDASSFVDTASGQRYVLYKVDGNSIGNGGSCGNTVAPIVATPIMLQAVAGDGVTLQGDAVQLFDNAGTSDDGIVEAPSLLAAQNGHILFFSSGCFSTTDYTVSYATSTAGITGPYTRRGALFSNGTNGLESPGGMDVDADGVHMVFHATVDNQREMWTAGISVDAGLGVSA